MRSLLLLFFIFPGVAFATTARVLVEEKAISSRLQGSFQVFCRKNRNDKRNLCAHSKGFFENDSWWVQVKRRSIAIKRVRDNKTYILFGKFFSLQGSFEWQSQNISRMDIVLKKEAANWVLHLPLEQYLYGVMASEVPASWPLEALKAQAVASRSYFLFKKRKSKNDFDVRSDILDQVFRLEKNPSPNIEKAVKETTGLILKNKNTKNIFPSYFHSDCGGETSTESSVWRSPASFNQSVQDPYCKSAKRNNWSYVLGRDHLMEKLHQSFLLPVGAELLNILPRTRGQRRALIVDFLFSKNLIKRMSANEFRKILGFGKLKSTHFHIKNKLGRFEFSGRGFGHGVGMCQWGAMRWARKGKGFQEILQHYYPGAQLQVRKEVGKKKLQAQATL